MHSVGSKKSSEQAHGSLSWNLINIYGDASAKSKGNF